MNEALFRIVGRSRLPRALGLLYVPPVASTDSLTRRFLLWFFEHPPFSPYVTVSCSLDISAARAYLLSLKERGTPVTIQTLLAASIGRTYAELPAANASVIGNKIVRFEDVGVVAPIDLSNHPGGLETGLIVLERANERTLLELGAQAKKTVDGERRGDRDNPFFRLVIPIAEKVPNRVLVLALDGFDRVARTELAAKWLRKLVPATVGLSNPGATLRLPAGGLMRGASMSMPDKIVSLGSLFGVGPIQDEVIAVEGAPAVRPMLPLIFVFDHRLFDGVYAGRVLTKLLEVLRDPSKVFGETGTASGVRVKS
ncbi:MAG: 2-oxo acid dehydrogenase subunit E2 [Deltaproteobacteria bacterium]|nr:2-oxo acid dehydrogenase subunit E2 [Deltaproteobacteria bacterium]